MDGVWETFHVRVADAGILTVAVSGGIGPQIAVNSLFEIRVAIPGQMTPQRYEVVTSRQ